MKTILVMGLSLTTTCMMASRNTRLSVQLTFA
jgi:hypothetical protein